MQSVITAEQAKKITGGRTPLVPVEYESAVKSLVACTTIDEAKYWSDKADALAAWAKIYKSDEAGLQAKRLRLHAYRRIGVLAIELNPRKYNGALKLLRSKGFAAHSANEACTVAKISEEKFHNILQAKSPPAPSGLIIKRPGASESWRRLAQGSGSGAVSLVAFAHYCRKTDPTIARDLAADEAKRARGLIQEISEWLDELDANLRKIG